MRGGKRSTDVLKVFRTGVKMVVWQSRVCLSVCLSLSAFNRNRRLSRGEVVRRCAAAALLHIILVLLRCDAAGHGKAEFRQLLVDTWAQI